MNVFVEDMVLEWACQLIIVLTLWCSTNILLYLPQPGVAGLHCEMKITREWRSCMYPSVFCVIVNTYTAYLMIRSAKPCSHFSQMAMRQILKQLSLFFLIFRRKMSNSKNWSSFQFRSSHWAYASIIECGRFRCYNRVVSLSIINWPN